MTAETLTKGLSSTPCSTEIAGNRELRMLHIEDNSDDADLTELLLRKARVPCRAIRVCEEGAFRAALAGEAFDFILSDFTMPRFDGLTALGIAQEQCPEVPFIFLSGTIGDERAVEALRRGATDYVLKDRMSRLPAAISRAIREKHDLNERRRMDGQLRESEKRFQHLLEHTPAVIYSLKVEGSRIVPGFVSGNVTRLLGFTVEECLSGEWWEDRLHPDDRTTALALRPALLNRGAWTVEYRLQHRDGSYHWVQDDARMVRDAGGDPIEIIGAWTDVTECKRTHKELIEASRLAGKAEVATGILHSVGNVLNSVNISLTLLRDAAARPRATSVRKVADLLNDQPDLAGFFTKDVRGKQLPKYLTELGKRMEAEEQRIRTEIETLQRDVDHVKCVVSMQQSHAKTCGLQETADVQTLVEDSLRLSMAATKGGDIKVVKEFSPAPPITIEKHKLLQILVNLIRNAGTACDERGGTGKVITLGVACDNGEIKISVADNGIGISPTNLARIFGHGFTTRKDGHGFGLHSAAVAAKELGGSLMVHSDGFGRGAIFTLALPAPPAEGS
jgi:PAS domain S-box-containing protein